MNPSGTLVLSPPGSEQGEARRRGPTGLQMPRNPTGLQMPEEENTLPSRFDRNIEKVYPVLGHRFVAKVGIHLPWWWQLFVLFFLQAFKQFVYCAVDREFIWGFGKQVICCFWSRTVPVYYSAKGLSCEHCGMTIHYPCYKKIVIPCSGSTWELLLHQNVVTISSGYLRRRERISWMSNVELPTTSNWRPTKCWHTVSSVVPCYGDSQDKVTSART